MATALPIEAIRSLIATLTGLPTSRIYWSGEAEKAVVGPFAGGKAGKITLNVPGIAEGSGFEPRRSYDADTDKLTEQYGRCDTVTISIRADMFLGFGEAYNMLNKLRLDISKPKHCATLRAAKLAYIEAPSLVVLDYTVDNRKVSAASLDIILSQAISTDDEEIHFISKVTSKSPPFTDDQVAALPVVDLAQKPPTP